MIPNALIEQLVNALKHTEKRKEYVKELQDSVWNHFNESDDDSHDEQVDEDWEVLSDLAYDLDFYEPNPEWRREFHGYFDDIKAEEKIKTALKKLKDIGYVISDEEEIL